MLIGALLAAARRRINDAVILAWLCIRHGWAGGRVRWCLIRISQTQRRAAIALAACAGQRRAHLSAATLERARHISERCIDCAAWLEEAAISGAPLPGHWSDLDDLTEPGYDAMDDALDLMQSIRTGGARP